MNVKIAQNAGFCFGVKRAMKMAWNELENGQNDIFALGPLIHNKQAVSKYEEKGLKTVDEVEKIPSSKNMIIRSHGVGENVYSEAKDKNINIIDTTCPFVKKIHSIVKYAYEEGQKIIVIGDSSHPEVIGINGWCNNSALVIKSPDQIKELVLDLNDTYCVVAQTTINTDNYNNIEEVLSNKINNINFNNTICSATKVRQQSARELSEEVDCMIVIGGKHSSNTQKLISICSEIVPTFAIETKEELLDKNLLIYNTVGVTAGASTPNWIINEVIKYIESL